MNKFEVLLKKPKNWLQNLRLKQRILIINLICVLIPLIAFGIYINFSNRNIMMDQMKETERVELSNLRDYLADIGGNWSDSSRVRTEYRNILSYRETVTAILSKDGSVIASNQNDVTDNEITNALKDTNLDQFTVKNNQRDYITGKVSFLGEKYLLTVFKTDFKIGDLQWLILSLKSYADIYSPVSRQCITALFFMLLCMIPSVIIISIFSKHFSNKLNAFQMQIHKTAAGDFKSVEHIEGQDEISELYEDLNTMIDSIQHLISTVYEEQVQKEKLNSRQKDVEFKMLASQINPHFLYNTLETIRMKARNSKETEIEELVKMLAKIMRRNIQVGDNLVTLKSELELVEYYLKIQQYRFGDRIRYEINLNCNIDYLKIMPLIIQPVVENAFVHGLETKEGDGEIRIIVERTDRLRIHIIDNGIGMTKAKLEEIKESLNDFKQLDRSHIGLSNVNQRIQLLYGEEYGIYIESTAGKGTSVLIELPENINQ